jgi:hypothetical protein
VATARETNVASALATTLEKAAQQWPEMAEANLRVNQRTFTDLSAIYKM